MKQSIRRMRNDKKGNKMRREVRSVETRGGEKREDKSRGEKRRGVDRERAKGGVMERER